MPNLPAALALLLVLALAGIARAGDDPFPIARVEVGPGPVLFLTRPDESSGARQEALYAFDLARGGEPARVLVLPSNLRVILRLGPTRFLLQTFQQPRGLFVLDLAAGKAIEVARAEGWLNFMAARGNSLFYLASGLPAQAGYTLESKEGDARAVDSPRNRAVLCVWDAKTGGAARAVCELPIETVLEMREKEAWVLTADDELWRVSLDGGETRRLIRLDPDRIPGMTTHALSPDGRRIALGIAPKESFFHKRHLVVLDTETGEEVWRQNAIETGVSMLSSSSPRLEVVWLDDRRVRWSETEIPEGAQTPDAGGRFVWVDADVTAGKILARRPYGPVGLGHSTPPRGDTPEPPPTGPRWPRGGFEQEGNRLYLAGRAEPVAEGTDLAVSPDGRWAAFVGREENVSIVGLVDAEKGTVRRLGSEWAYDLHWFPAIEEPGADPGK